MKQYRRDLLVVSPSILIIQLDVLCDSVVSTNRIRNSWKPDRSEVSGSLFHSGALGKIMEYYSFLRRRMGRI